jgi:hypothetical protein
MLECRDGLSYYLDTSTRYSTDRHKNMGTVIHYQDFQFLMISYLKIMRESASQDWMILNYLFHTLTL